MSLVIVDNDGRTTTTFQVVIVPVLIMVHANSTCTYLALATLPVNLRFVM